MLLALPKVGREVRFGFAAGCEEWLCPADNSQIISWAMPSS